MASRLLSSALNKAVGSQAGASGPARREEKMDVDGFTPVASGSGRATNDRRNAGGPTQKRGARAHHNHSTPYGRPPPTGPRDIGPGPARRGRGININGIAAQADASSSSLRLADRIGRSAAGASSVPQRPNTNTERAHNARVRQSQTVAGALPPKRAEAPISNEQKASNEAFKASVEDGSFKAWLSGRYTVEGGILDLSALAADPWFAQHGIIPFTEPTAFVAAGTSFFVAVNNVAQREESMPIKIINFANNGLVSLEQLSRCSWYLRQVERISLANNPIPSVDRLQALLRAKLNPQGKYTKGKLPKGKYRYLVELDLSGVPFVADLLKDGDEAYRKTITDMFPKLEILDTVSLAALDANNAAPAEPVQAAIAPNPVIAPAPVIAPPMPIPQVESDMDKFARMSGMTMEWTIKCVQDNGGDFDKAWANFESLKDQIPAEAFVRA